MLSKLWLEALLLYQAALRGLNWAEVLEGKPSQDWPGIRGGISMAGFEGAQQIIVNPSWTYAGGELHHRVEVSREGGFPQACFESLRFESEALRKSQVLYDVTKDAALSGTARVSIASRGQGKREVQELPAFGYLGRQIRPASRIRDEVWDALQFIHSRAESWLFLEPVPALMRNYCFEGHQMLGSNGENLSAILYQLSQNGKGPDLFDWLQELIGEDLAGIDFERDGMQQVRFSLIERKGQRIPARAVSDGTLRFLAILCALLGQPEQSLVLMEEIDMGLHPSRLQTLSEFLVQMTSSGKRQIIATTHSPQLLAALPRERLLDVVLCAKNPYTQGTVARRLRDQPDFEEILQRRPIEYLLTTQWLERALA